jgi:hypothetical protein
VSRTGVFGGNDAVHVPGQLMPAGALVTVPPVPVTVTLSSAKCWKVAMMSVVAVLVVTVHVFEFAAHPAPQLTKPLCGSGVSINTTDGVVNTALHRLPHVIIMSDELTVPIPVG